MRTAPQIIHAAAGAPEQRLCVALEQPVACYLCGGTAERGAPVAKALGGSSTFAAWALAQWSDTICESCVWACGGKPGQQPPPLRMTSHLWRDGEWVRFDKSRVDLAWRAILDPPDGPWFLALAETGQVQVVPWTPVNAGLSRDCWRVRYEREDVAQTVGAFARTAYAVLSLYLAGYPRQVILAGNPDVNLLRRCGADVWREHDRRLARKRGSATLRLACALLRKDGMDEWRDLAARAGGIDAAAGRGAADAGDRADAGVPPLDRLAAREPADVLGADAGGRSRTRSHGDDVRRARRAASPRPADP